MNHYRNGDWSFHEIDQKTFDKLSKTAKTIKHKGEVIFAEGEATGHLHKVTVKEKDNMTFHKMPDGSYLVSLEEEAVVNHPEHSMKVDLKLPSKKYLLYQRKEKDWLTLATRKVID